MLKYLSLLFFSLTLTACFTPESTSATKESQKKIASSDKLVFIGEITDIQSGGDGDTVELTNTITKEVLYAVISIPNLGPNTTFDFSTVKLGNILKVTGEPFQLNLKTQMAARTVMSFSPITVQDKTATKAEKLACEKANGNIQKVGKAQWERCVQPLPDAGKLCSDSSECFGRCLLPTSADHAVPGDRVDGVCSDTNHRFGCQSLVSGGKFKGTLCID